MNFVQTLTAVEKRDVYKRQADDDTNNDQQRHQITHDIAGFQTCNSQGRQCPEGLNQVRPAVTPGNTHAAAGCRNAHLCCSGHHDGTLNLSLIHICLSIEKFNDLKEGDQIEAFIMEEIKQ